jgi:zinc resistance-associated protein
MRKVTIVLVMVVALSLVASQALACMWDGYDGGPMGGPMMGGYNSGVAPSGVYQIFLDETQDLRQELAAKQGEYNALMAKSNPDPQKAGQISREIAGMHGQLQAKASARGLGAQGGQRPYSAPMRSYGYGSGYGGWACW